jgi:hypothetical protein
MTSAAEVSELLTQLQETDLSVWVFKANRFCGVSFCLRHLRVQLSALALRLRSQLRATRSDIELLRVHAGYWTHRR